MAHNGAAGTAGMAGMLLRNDALHTVDFTGCRFDDQALKKLASVLPATDSLKMIVVDPGVGAALVRTLATVRYSGAQRFGYGNHTRGRVASNTKVPCCVHVN